LNTTVTVDDSTRRRLKRLAAILDETQGDIVRRAVALYESRLNTVGEQRKVPRKVAEELEKASIAIRRKDSRWARVSEIIEQTETSISEFSPASWGKET
jgi:hypothetical protein